MLFANRLLCVVLLLSGGTVLSGCGQTGALYFDEDPPADQLPPSRRSSPATVVPVPAAVDMTVPDSPEEPVAPSSAPSATTVRE